MENWRTRIGLSIVWILKKIRFFFQRRPTDYGALRIQRYESVRIDAIDKAWIKFVLKMNETVKSEVSRYILVPC